MGLEGMLGLCMFILYKNLFFFCVFNIDIFFGKLVMIGG